MHGEAAPGPADAGCAVVHYSHTPPVPAPSPCWLAVWKALASRAGALATNEERT